MFKWILLSFLVVITSMFVFVATYVGAFRSVSWTEEVRGPYYLIYKSQRGPYEKVVNTILEAEEALSALGITCPKTFGRYLDQPDRVDADRLRAEAGCLFEEDPIVRPEGFNVSVIPPKKYLVGLFTGAPSIGPLKVYPKAKKRLAEMGITTEIEPLEVYTLTDGQGVITEYHFEIGPTPTETE